MEQAVIIGAGPAGLTAAYELVKTDIQPIVVEKDDCVGGISRTVDFNGYLFDIGGHRFFTKVTVIRRMWQEVLGPDFIRCQRLSRIYYNRRFFDYPLRISNVLSGLGLWTSFLIFLSYLYAQLFPEKPERTFRQWVSNRFGRRLFSIFFQSYTEKVWGMSCDEISSDWAAQRIRGLSFMTAVQNALIKPRASAGKETVTTLIDTFHYPRLGPGMMWERVRRITEAGGGIIRMQTAVEKIHWQDNRVQFVDVCCNGTTERIRGSVFISSMPLRELLHKFTPSAPDNVIEAANRLRYRDFVVVAVIIDKAQLFADNWIYIHDPDVRVGRIQNFKNWSPEMVPDARKTCLGMEYFCFEGDGLWCMSDKDLLALARRELVQLGFVDAAEIEDGAVVRMPKAYPVYDATYQASLTVIRRFLDAIDNLQVIGRNGMHKYNNQDHSMLTAILAVENLSGAKHDLWQVNVDQEYHETVRRHDIPGADEISEMHARQPRVPLPVTQDATG